MISVQWLRKACVMGMVLCGLPVGAVMAGQLPEGAKVTASFKTEGDKSLTNLFDGDEKTVMIGAPGTADEGKVVWIDITFAKPIDDLAGIQTGKSDVYHNYYPKRMEFWGDSDGNGTFDTLLGKTDKLGPADQSAGKQMFDGRLETLHGLRIRVTDQNVTGLKRAFTMNEIDLIRSKDAAVIKPTPDKSSDQSKPEPAAKAAEEASSAQPVAVAADASIVPDSASLPGSILPLPEGTKITTSFKTEKDSGPEKLFDNDLSTWMNPGGGTAPSPDAISTITLRFAKPVADLAGVEFGQTDAYGNYYPEEVEFWADSNGDGRCDTKLGTASGLKPGKGSVARHMFAASLAEAHALEIRCVRQHVAGGKRVYAMNEMRLVRSDQLPRAQTTPNSWRNLTYQAPMPDGATITASFACEAGKGPEVLLDKDPETFTQAQQGTAKKGVPASLFLRFSEPLTDLSGITLGRSDPFNNYVWNTLEIHGDANGDGKYTEHLGTFSGGGSGNKMFSKPAGKVYGLELRVTDQKLGGTFRAFALNELTGLVYVDDTGDSQMKLVVEDFEDFSSWRTWGSNTGQPEGARPYGGYIYLCGVLDKALAHAGEGVGQMRYTFKPGGNSYGLWATRGRVFEQGGIIDAINFNANPQGYPCSVHFELLDAKGRKFRTPTVELTKQGWSEYSVAINSQTIPDLGSAVFPMSLKLIFMNSKQAGEGVVLFDDITLVGAFDRSRRMIIKPVYAGLAYDPEKALAPSYVIRSSVDQPLSCTLTATLYSSFDPKREKPIKRVELPVELQPFGMQTVQVDFGQTPYGHYEADLVLHEPKTDHRLTDQLAVMTPNGGRINQTAMYFGSQHPGSWIARPENEFVFKQVVEPLGLDCYRTGAPASDASILLDTNLLLAAGLGGVPPELRQPKQKNDDRGEPTDYQAYAEWCKTRAREDYLPYADRILSLEFYNEPDLPNFCYLPEIDTYLKMFRVYAKAFREEIPGIKIGAGGNTVQHGKEKVDFNRRMYTELANETDVANWHAHGGLDNYSSRQRLVEKWQELGGKPIDKQLLGNTEAGQPSGETAIGRLRQAEILVKKIGWAKSQADSYFYCWFTTTDTYDPQGGYLNNENWGLITYNQRLKSSGQAYNELIRMLANTKPLGEEKLDNRLQSCLYQREDGSKVWLSWPIESGLPVRLLLVSAAPITQVDMFGRRRRIEPDAEGRLNVLSEGYPFYLEVPAGTELAPAPRPAFVDYKDIIGVPPNGKIDLPINLKNTWNQPTSLKIELLDANGQSVAQTSANLAVDQSLTTRLTHPLPKATAIGSMAWALRITGGPENQSVNETFPLTVVVAQMAVRASDFKIDGTPDAIPAATPILSNAAIDVHDLVADPSTPNWSGPSDLSATTILAHDDKGLYVSIDVRDQTHKPGPASDKLWIGDSIQIAFDAMGARTEIGLTEADGGFGWVYSSPDAKRIGQKLSTPVAVKRAGDHTIYEMFLPFDTHGIAYHPMFPLRMTLLVNEDDGRGRVRLLKWFDGIAASKDVALFGYVVLD